MQLQRIWKLKIPMKIRIFLWQVTQDRLPTREQLLARRGPTNGICPMCSCVETIDHLLFSCQVASFGWVAIKEAVDWPGAPLSVMDLNSLARNGGAQFSDLVWVGAVATM